MLLKVHQHQPTREEAVEQKTPTARRGKILVAIKQNQLVGLWSEQGDAAYAEKMVAIDRAVLAVHLRDMADRILEGGKGIADDRPAVFAGEMRQPVALGSGAEVCGRVARHWHAHNLPPQQGLARWIPSYHPTTTRVHKPAGWNLRGGRSQSRHRLGFAQREVALRLEVRCPVAPFGLDPSAANTV